MMDKLGLTEDEFVDMCILCGCDYVPRVSGVGPVKAFKLIQDHRSMENIIDYFNR